MTGPATDSSGYVITMSGDDQNAPTVTVSDSHGTQVYPQVVDRYGNFWSYDSAGNLVDDRGQTPVITTVSGNLIYYDVLTPKGRARYTVTTTSFPIGTSQFHQSNVEEYDNGPLPTIKSIQLPDGSTYSFTYEFFFGELRTVTLPTGGVIDYKWNTFYDSYGNANRWLASRTAGSDPPTTFTPKVITQCNGSGAGCQEQMTVHQPSGNETVYNLTLNNGAWNTNTQRFSGAATNGKLVSTTDSDYDFSLPCGSSCTGSQFITAQRVTTTLADVNLKLTDEYSYADSHLGLVGSKKRYDFYAGSLPRFATIETKYTYGSKIPGDITQVKTVDGDGDVISLDNLTYLTTPGPPSGVVDGHDATKSQNSWYQSIAHWINTSGAFEITYFSRDDAGTIYEQSLPYNSAVGGLGTSPKRTFGHDATDTFVTSTTEPIPSSGVAMSSAASFEPASGFATSATDYNGQTSSLGSYDYLGRVGEVDSPDHGVTSFSYAPTSKTTSTLIDSRWATTVETADGFGRPSRSSVSNGQNGAPSYQQDTCYNSNGQVQSVSLPYAGTGDMPTNCSGTQYTYDALGRPKTVTNADGTTQYNYTGRATQTIDVNGRQKITQVDGLGRLTAVCEVSSQNVVGSSPQNCGLDISGLAILRSTPTIRRATSRRSSKGNSAATPRPIHWAVSSTPGSRSAARRTIPTLTRAMGRW